MVNRYLAAAFIGTATGVFILVTGLVLWVAGFVGGFVVPFFSLATSCGGWAFTAIVLVSAGWYAASYAWARGAKDSIGVAVVTGLVAGLISQLVNLAIALLLSVFTGVIGAVGGYALANGGNPFLYAALGGLGGWGLAIVIALLAFGLWTVLSVVLSAAGGALYARKARDRDRNSGAGTIIIDT